MMSMQRFYLRGLSLLLLGICGAGSCGIGQSLQAADAAEVPQVVLDRTLEFGVAIRHTRANSLWRREVMRQGLLLAARAEMRLPTADIVLGEFVPTDHLQSLELTCKYVANANRIQLLQGARDKREAVWTHEFANTGDWPPHRPWVERMEALSRTGFVEALEKAHFVRREALRANDAAGPLYPQLSDTIDKELNFVGQMLALRQLHAELNDDGETRARLAGIVRAYSHLGLLTEYQWHPMSYALKARALLYAQRWVVRDPKSALAMQHRAYAFALVGMHADALTDLQAATKLAAGSTSEPPAWVPLIEAYCRFEYETLNDFRTDERVKPLASLLCFLAFEQEGSHNLTVKVGLELMEELPGCYRMLDTLCHYTGPGAGQITTQAGPMHLATTLLPRLAEVQDLPAHVRTAIEEARAAGALLTPDSQPEAALAEIEHRAKVMSALRAPSPAAAGARDVSEPSWSVLAQIIEETSFLQLFRRAYFIRNQIGVPADEYLDAYTPVVEKHRYAPFLDLLFRTQSDQQKVKAALQGFDYNDNDFVQSRLWERWPEEFQANAYRSAYMHKEALPNEQALAARSYDVSVNRALGSTLAVSPHSPYAMAVALAKSFKTETEEEKAWQEAAKRSPHLAQKFAEIWTVRNKPAEAERFLKLATKLDPSPQNYRQLAHHYKTRGNDELWLQALDDFLKTPSLGLQHAQVQCEIATYYADRREWDKALPYADSAAETGAQWAMNWSRTANEVNQNWDAAEQAYVKAIQRYGEDPILWYFFCQRNGCGHLDIARKAAFPEGVEQKVLQADYPINYAASALLLEGQPRKALELYEAEAKTSPASWTAMQAALTADLVGDKAKRDKFLKLVVEQPAPPPNKNDARPHREEIIELARKLIADLAAGGKCGFKLDELHSIRDRVPERDRCSFNYFLGRYLDLHGKPGLAIDYWKKCMGAQDLVMSTRTMAGYELHKRDIKPSEWKPLLFLKPENAK